MGFLERRRGLSGFLPDLACAMQRAWITLVVMIILPDYLMRPSVKAEGSPKEAESIVGRTKSTPLERK